MGDKHHTLDALLLVKRPTVQDGWDSGAGLDRHGKSHPPPPNVVQTLDCPTCNEFLYCVYYPGHHRDGVHKLFIDPENGGSMLCPNDGNDLPDDAAT
jgi:hypothetical protein